MRLPQRKCTDAALLSSILFPTFISAFILNCGEIVTEGKRWDLSKLGGPRSVMSSVQTPPSIRNTTYTVDICRNLVPDDSVDKKKRCPSGTRVCGIEHTINTEDGTDLVTEVIPIAGDLENSGGGSLDVKITRLRTAVSHKDSEREGLRVELNGGFYGSPKRKQKAVIEFLCSNEDPDPEGGDKEGEETEKRELDPSIPTFLRYDKDIPDTDVDTLRLEWYTRYACEDQKGKDDEINKTHWGFFTWFLIIAFLVTAAYLIFGSWLNYNRYGARGWDLLPHGDTIRDVPYLLKDWTRRVVNTVQGSGSRGGYSAV